MDTFARGLKIAAAMRAHKAAKAARWIEAKRERQAKLELCFMPGLSPELNPDELLNQDTK